MYVIFHTKKLQLLTYVLLSGDSQISLSEYVEPVLDFEIETLTPETLSTRNVTDSSSFSSEVTFLVASSSISSAASFSSIEVTLVAKDPLASNEVISIGSGAGGGMVVLI